MKQSEDTEALSAAMCAAQAMMGGAIKDSSNPFFKSSYADLTSVVKALKEPFAKHGLSYTQQPLTQFENGIAYFGVTTRLMHISGEWLEDGFVLPLVKQDPQAAGSAITYCRRYALQAMAGIPTADDDGEAAMLRDAGVVKKTVQDWAAELAESIEVIKGSIHSGDYSSGAEAWIELSDEEKHGIWVAPSKNGPFTTHERKVMQSTSFKNGDNINPGVAV